jgi:O-antigen/teichoic acid export membrane protein
MTDYFSDESTRQGLRAKTLRGGVTTLATQGVGVLQMLVSLLVLSRLLDPSDFGLMAMVTPLTGFATMFVNSGMSIATIQHPGITHRQLSTMFWLATALGVGVAGLVAASAPLLEAVYREPRVVPIAIALSVTFVFAGLTVQHEALLRRTMQFDRMLVVQTSASLVSLVVMLAVAWATRSYWALVVRALLDSGMRMVGVWLACRWRPGSPSRGSGVRKLLELGLGVAGSNVLTYFAENVEFVLLGRRWGDAVLGGYERAHKCFWQPVSAAQQPLQSLLPPALSRLDHDPKRQREVLLTLVGGMFGVLAPAVVWVLALAPEVVRVLLGPTWDHVVPVFRVLAVGGLVQSVWMSANWVLTYQGRSADLMRCSGVSAVVAVVGALVGVQWGAVGAATGFTVGLVFLRVPFALWVVGRSGNVSGLDLAKAPLRYWPTPLAAALACGLCWPVLSVERPLTTLILSGSVTLTAWVGALGLTPAGRVLRGKLMSEVAKRLRRR